MSSPTITVRQLSATGDPLYGQGQANYISDLAAVTQIVKTRLLLFQGEWWAATNDGLPLFQGILGQSASQRNQQQIELLITERILGTPYVISVSDVTISFNQTTRAYSYYAVVNTQFGQFTTSGSVPQPPSAALPESITIPTTPETDYIVQEDSTSEFLLENDATSAIVQE